MNLTRVVARRSLACAVGLALFVPGIAPVHAAPPSSNNNTSKKLRAAVSAEGIMEHLSALQAIADANGGTRVSGTPGYDLSADYAAGVFAAAGYTVTRQNFQFQTFIELPGTTSLERVSPAPAGPLASVIMSYSGSGDVTAPVSLTTDAASVASQGCEASDFTGFPAGNIALMSRGGCPFALKATNAQAAGASAVVIYNNAAGDLNGTLGNTFGLNISVVGITQALGTELAAVAGLVLRIRTSTVRGTATTSNVIAESKTGDPNNVVMAGAHLDSVAAGPGINDNGSGSGAILEVAEQMAKVKPYNKVRFALWGAEEANLVGSTYYINDLKANNAAELDRIALYLNFDMIASPNYVRFVYDGDNSAFPVGPGAAAGPPGSAQIEDLFHDYFQSVGLASAETAFSGRSDYGPFIAAGVDIPSGGLFTGAEGTKTPEQEAIYGGVAGAAYDPCYHQACDELTPSYGADAAKAALYAQLNAEYRMAGNVNLDALEEMSDAVAHAVITYAFNTTEVNGVGRSRPVSPPGQDVDGTPGNGQDDSGGGLHAEHDELLAS